MDWQTVQHFKQHEWEPHSELVHPKLIYLIDAIRHEYEKKIFIHCAFAQSGHSKKSWHYKKDELDGMSGAVDLHFEEHDYRSQFDLIRSFDDVGAIGFYPHWSNPGFHIDIRPNRLYWTERNGIYIYDINAVLEDLHDAENV